MGLPASHVLLGLCLFIFQGGCFGSFNLDKPIRCRGGWSDEGWSPEWDNRPSFDPRTDDYRYFLEIEAGKCFYHVWRAGLCRPLYVYRSSGDSSNPNQYIESDISDYASAKRLFTAMSELNRLDCSGLIQELQRSYQDEQRRLQDGLNRVQTVREARNASTDPSYADSEIEAAAVYIQRIHDRMQKIEVFHIPSAYAKRERIQSILDYGWERISSISLQYYQQKERIWSALEQFDRTLLLLEYGMVEEAIYALEKLIDSGLAQETVWKDKQATIDFYSNLSLAHSECGEFGEAVLCLNKAIQLAPGQKSLYLARAMAYFETGSLDASLADYLAYGRYNPSTMINLPEVAEFGAGIACGLAQGVHGALKDFVPSLLSSAHGLAEGLWALASSPIKISREYCQSALACIEIVRQCPMDQIVGVMAPELAELASQWDALSANERGYRTGAILGKYGIDIFAGAALIKGVKAYRELKQANAILTLETLAVSGSEQRAALLASQAQYVARRRAYIEQLRIEPDKQGKHIVGHNSYAADGEVFRSIWTDPDPEGLIKLHAGSGRHVRGTFGSPGHKEIVDCGRVIGFHVHYLTGERLPTTMAQIHYSKNGAHIVPSHPKP